ncbi:hypothetical protein IE00_14025 [Paracoccus sp. SM22M-07]|nr:hypothetical protein IE00_14025 [Paracoccus sp. SM22M-07]
MVTHSAVLAQLQAAKLLHGLLWTMERRLAHKPFVALEQQPQEVERLSGIEEDVHGLRELNAAMLMIRPKIMTEIMRDSSITWGGRGGRAPLRDADAVHRIQAQPSVPPRRADTLSGSGA